MLARSSARQRSFRRRRQKGRLMGRRVTIEEIARQSNASVSTVSLVLRNRPGISPSTRQRVLDAARALGYPRRAQTPEDPTRETLTVGLVLRARNRPPDVGV